MDKFFAASLDQNILTIDLHTTTNVNEALEKLEQELFLVYKKETQYCRVIYGIGEGVLEQAVLLALKKHPMVVDVKEEGGSCLVIL